MANYENSAEKKRSHKFLKAAAFVGGVAVGAAILL